MIAKIIAHGEDRAAARARLRRALAETAVLGVATNLGFSGAIVAASGFRRRRGRYRLYRAPPRSVAGAGRPPPTLALAAAALDRLLPREAAAPQRALRPTLVARRETAGGSISHGYERFSVPLRRDGACAGGDRERSRIAGGCRLPTALHDARGERGRTACSPSSSMACAAPCGCCDTAMPTAVFVDGESWRLRDDRPAGAAGRRRPGCRTADRADAGARRASCWSAPGTRSARASR